MLRQIRESFLIRSLTLRAARAIVEACDLDEPRVQSLIIGQSRVENGDSSTPNKSLAPCYLEAQHDSMNTKKNIRLLTIIALLLTPILFGICGCMGKHTDENTTPSPTPPPAGS